MTDATINPAASSPWRTLAIAESAARDRWGHAFSYRVADSLTTEASLLNAKVDDALVLCLDPACTEYRHDPKIGTGAAFVVIGHGEHAPGSFIADSGQRARDHRAARKSPI